jgi:hypothetical protein
VREGDFLDSHPRLSSGFNLLIGISLLVVGYGILLYSDALYSSMTNPCGIGVTGCVSTSVIDISPLYIFFGAGIVVMVYSLKLIFFGVLGLMKPAQKALDATESVGKIAFPFTPPPQMQEKVLTSAKVARCSYCDAEIPVDATYCPNCFQKRKISA